MLTCYSCPYLLTCYSCSYYNSMLSCRELSFCSRWFALCKMWLRRMIQVAYIITDSFLENTFKTALIKSDFLVIFLFAFSFLQQTYLERMKWSIIIISLKESLMMKGLKLFFKIYRVMTGKPLKLSSIHMKLTIISWWHFVQFMTHF